MGNDDVNLIARVFFGGSVRREKPGHTVQEQLPHSSRGLAQGLGDDFSARRPHLPACQMGHPLESVSFFASTTIPGSESYT